jgi:hypothetical protein
MGVDLEYTYPTEEVRPAWTLTNGAPAEGYTPASLADDNPAAPYKVDSTYLRLVGDAGAPVPVSVAVIIHPNFDEGLGGIYLQANATGDFSGGASLINVPFTTPHWLTDEFPVNLVCDLRALGSPAYRYWSIVTGDGTGAVDANSVPLSLGEVKLYTVVHALEGSLVLDLQATEQEAYPIIDHVSEGDVTMLYPLGTKRRYLRGGVLQAGAAAVQMQQWWRASRGRSLPFVVFVTEAEGAERAEPWLCRFEKPALDRVFTYGSAMSTFTLELEEISRGLRPTPMPAAFAV